MNKFFTSADIGNISYRDAINDPGQLPFTRGIYPEMYRAKLWTMRQYSGFGDAKATNARFKHLLKQGQHGLSVAFDLPTQMGYDPDSPEALGEVGRVGVSIASIEDMEELFSGIPLEQVSTSMTINATASILLAFYAAVGNRRKIPVEKLSGTLQNDLLKEYIARGTYIFPAKFSLRLVVDIIEYCQKHLPKMNPISISGYHMREAGATAVQEIAFTFANAITYLNEAKKRGLSAETLGKQISFFFACNNNFLEEIAKFRAARRLWTEIIKTQFNVTDPKAMMLRFHTQTAGSTLTSQQPMNNVVRVAYQALAAVFGGTQSLHTNAYDEALALPTEESATLALRTQQIIAYETKVPEVADPLGGSYCLESLTDRLFEEARRLLREVEDRGGALECVQSGYFSEAIQQSAYEAQKLLEKNESVIVGVNRHLSDEEKSIPVLKIDPDLENQAVIRIKKLRAERDPNKVFRALKQIEQASLNESENLVPLFLEAVSCNTTLGEICSRLKGLFGEYDLGTFRAENES